MERHIRQNSDASGVRQPAAFLIVSLGRRVGIDVPDDHQFPIQQCGMTLARLDKSVNDDGLVLVVQAGVEATQRDEAALLAGGQEQAPPRCTDEAATQRWMTARGIST